MLDVRLRHQLARLPLDVEFSTPKGVTALFGPSGAGKTSIVNAVAGLMRPTGARISVSGQVLCDTDLKLWVPPHRREIGYIFQDARLFPHLTVKANLSYGRWFSRHRNQPNFDRIVEMLGLGTLLARRVAALSGGEKQRVAIGRALLAAPKLILADEPLAALDSERKAEILPYFERLRDEVDTPILYVSHSLAEIARLATTVVVLAEGRVVTCAPTKDVLQNPALLQYGDKHAGAVLQMRVETHHADGLTELGSAGESLLLPRLGIAVGSPVCVRIAAQDVILSTEHPTGLSALNIIAGTIKQVHQDINCGATVAVQTAAGVILARLTLRSLQALNLQEGSPCYAIVKSVALADTDQL
ncbi:molybdate transport system ATP-binding protein [Epibacterium ulvae]|uniref:Molybdate transport system ATP-binding protein n=1 Tax=Epibacterium ulvae TaxID=1156985 RepID=A0A1G5PK22_9RHOB|nr:molybdenum ABC transporter ATP-binding protein [Epibacterium ulvae]SCZ49399.1 molybdate transport system ATP-binding protein [Epibacterium ulvae]